MEINKQQIQVYWNINWLRRSLISLLLLLVVVLVLPVVVQFTLSHQLKKLGASHADIDDINLNLFAGSFEIKQLQYSTSTNQPAELNYLLLDINMLDLIASKIVVKHLLIEGLKVDISKHKNGELSVSGLNIPMQDASSKQSVSEKSSDPLMFAIERFGLQNSNITYRETDFEQVIAVESITLQGVTSWEADSTAELLADVKLNKAGVMLKADMDLFSEHQKLTGQVNLNDLNIADFSKFYRDHINRLEGSVTLTTEFDVVLGHAIAAKVNSEVNIRDLNADYQHLNLHTAAILWKGNTVYSSQSPLKIDGDLAIKKNVLYERKAEYLLSAFDELTISGLAYGSEEIRLNSLQTRNLQFIDLPLEDGSQENLFANIESIGMQKLSLKQTEAELNVETIELENPQLKLSVSEDKRLTHLSALLQSLQPLSQTSTSEESAEKIEQTQAEETKPLGIQIDKVILQKPGAINITDNSVSPTYKSVIHLNKIEIEDVSSVSPATFVLNLQQGDYTDIEVKGKGLLLDPADDLQLTASIKQLDLPPVTPYSSHFMGYGMRSGAVDSEIQLKLKNREIDSMVDLNLHSIEIVETNKESAEHMRSASGMSIDLAVSRLKDSNNDISLKIPVKGKIDNPDFDLSQIINKAMGKAMQAATLSYLKHSLQPYGTLITLFEVAKAAAGQINLPPVLFQTNSSQFKDGQQDLLSKVIKILQERPGIRIKACGVSSLDDWKAIEAELMAIKRDKLKKQNKKADKITIAKEVIQEKARDLANQRSAKVKAYLISNGKIEKGRVLNCLSATKQDDKSVASVELQI